MPSNDNADWAYFSVGFVTALVPSEFVSCVEVLKRKGWTELVTDNPELIEGCIRLWSKEFSGKRVLAYSIAIADMGQVASALETFMFLTKCPVNELFLTGIAGSLHEKKVLKADVVIGTAIHWRSQNRIFGDDPCDNYRVKNHNLNGYSHDLSRKIQFFVQEHYQHKERKPGETEKWNVWSGGVFTWDYVVDSQRVTGEINRSFPEALCVEMEAGGFLSAIDRYSKLANKSGGSEGESNIQGFVIRGISDYAAKKDKELNARNAASTNAAEVSIDFAEHRIRAALEKRVRNASTK